jgi:peptidyl-dipeptidase Dcp
VLHAETAEVISEKQGDYSIPFDVEGLKSEENIVLFVIETEKFGKIILDLFQREAKFNQNQVSTLTEVGSSKLEGQTSVAYVVDGMQKNLQYLSFDQVKTVFHEFGHALDIALCNSKYQYNSGARVSLEIAEIPSHFL